MSDFTSPHRRDFLKASAAVLAAGGTASATSPLPAGKAKSCIFLMLTGGPSQLDTWDPKPAAASDVRSPFAPIRTAVPGTHLSELFPKMAAMADKFSLIRALHHEHDAVHETGFQLLNTGRRFGAGVAWPSVGAVLAQRTPVRNDGVRPWWVLPHDRVETGTGVGHGQGVGYLRAAADRHERFSCSYPFPLMAGAAYDTIELGAQFVTVNAYPTVFDSVSWDCHAAGGSLRTTLADYRDDVAPTFDAAFTTLLTRLEQSGRLSETLVVAVGEFGRTPKLNCHGGRDHWAKCWTAIVAGGGVQGGRVIGASDAIAAEPKDRPVHCRELVATIYHALGVSPATTMSGPDGTPVRVVDAEPVRELF